MSSFSASEARIGTTVPSADSDHQGGVEPKADTRTSPRRPTHVRVAVIDGPSLAGRSTASDVSADGAFICTTTRHHPGARLQLRLELPTDTRPVEVTARVVRSGDAGIGVRFENMSARDRSRLRSHAGYTEMDEAIVRLQQRLGDLIPGNLLPLGDLDEIEQILTSAAVRELEVTVVRPGRGFAPRVCRLGPIEHTESTGDGDHLTTVQLLGLDLVEDGRRRVLHVAFSDGPLHYAFEGIVLRYGRNPVLLRPERIYVTERRTDTRSSAGRAWCVFGDPSKDDDRALRFPLLDLGVGGASVGIPEGTPLPPGTHLPAFQLETEHDRRPIPGATVRYVNRQDDGRWRAGLHFDDAASQSEAFETRQQRTVRPSITRRLRQVAAMAWARMRGALPSVDEQTDVEVVRFRNRRGLMVVGIVDANYDTSDPTVVPDVAVLVAPALLKRKEVFALQSRTIVDDIGRDGKRVVCLRIDFCNIVGESSMDPDLVARGTPYLDWDMTQLVDDTEAALQYLQQRFRPQHKVLVSYSFSAIGGRKVVQRANPPLSQWVAPFGCPDQQDMLRNYLAGLDLFPVYAEGDGPEHVFIHGRPVRGRNFYNKAAEHGLAYLDQARADLATIETPITWIVGTYDHWVTRSRVKALLEAPGGGVREVFECATGHVLKQGPEAIEVFKLVSESISKHVFGEDRPARDPDLVRFDEQSRAEWARVKTMSIANTQSFWREHLFGDDNDSLGYDIVLEHPDYRHFMERQAELLDPRDGDHVADFGCGTGNLAAALLGTYPSGQRPRSLTLLDLVPEALERSEHKLLERFPEERRPEELRKLTADLEVSRFACILDFLSGHVYGIEGLVGRIEGLTGLAASKVSEAYSKELHAILRGRPSTRERVRQLCPQLSTEEADVVLEIGRASRFVSGDPLPEDLVSPGTKPRTARDLKFEQLRFGHSSTELELPIPSNSLDKIGCSLVVSYLNDPIVALREMHRVLRPGGTMIVSSIRPNFDPSKLYSEEAEIVTSYAIEEDEKERKLDALRAFANMMSRLVELEEDGRFRFFSGQELRELVLEAGFGQVHVFETLGNPPTAVVVRAEKTTKAPAQWAGVPPRGLAR